MTTASGEWKKARPNIDLDNKEFWDGLAEHKFLLWNCGECGAWYWPKAYCRNHANQPFASQMAWRESSGRGKIFSANTHNWVFDPAWADDTPFTYVLVELEEGPMISSTLLETVEDPIAIIGSDVEVVYEDHLDLEDGFVLPKFKLVSRKL